MASFEAIGVGLWFGLPPATGASLRGTLRAALLLIAWGRRADFARLQPW